MRPRAPMREFMAGVRPVQGSVTSKQCSELRTKRAPTHRKIRSSSATGMPSNRSPGHIQYLQFDKRARGRLIVSVSGRPQAEKARQDTTLYPDDLRASSLAAMEVRGLRIRQSHRRQPSNCLTRSATFMIRPDARIPEHHDVVFLASATRHRPAARTLW